MIDRLRRMLPFPVVCALGLLGALHGQRAFVQPAPSYGCCNADQILGRAERLCRVLLPQGGALRLSVEHTADGASVPQWTVNVSDESGTDILNLAWDATSGTLGRVSFTAMPSQKPFKIHGRRLTDREIVRAAWSWMQTIGFVREASGWRLAGAPEPGPEAAGVAAKSLDRVEAETVVWKSRDLVAEIQVDSWTGHLIVAQSWRSNRR